MSKSITSWIAKALIDQEARHGGNYQVPRSGQLVQLVKFLSFRDETKPEGPVRATVHDETHEVDVVFEADAVDSFEASQYGVQGERLTKHKRHVFRLTKYTIDLGHPLQRSSNAHTHMHTHGQHHQIPLVQLRISEWDLVGGHAQDPIFQERVQELGRGKSDLDVKVQRVLIKWWYGVTLSQEHHPSASAEAGPSRLPGPPSAFAPSSNAQAFTSGPVNANDFLVPFRTPSNRKPIPDWLFEVAPDQREQLDGIRMFEIQAFSSSAFTPGSVERMSQGGSGKHYLAPDWPKGLRGRNQEEGEEKDVCGPPMSSPVSSRHREDHQLSQHASPRTGESDKGKDESAGQEARSDEDAGDSEAEWQPTPDTRRRGPASVNRQSQRLSPPVSSEEMSAPVLVHVPAQTLDEDENRKVEHRRSDRIDSLYPQQNILRSPTPAVLRGYTSRTRPVQKAKKSADEQDMESLASPRSESSPTSPSRDPPAPESSGQSMAVRPLRAHVSRDKRNTESLDITGYSYSASQAMTDDLADSEKGTDVDEGSEHSDRETETEEPSATIPLPPPGQKRTASMMLASQEAKQDDDGMHSRSGKRSRAGYARDALADLDHNSLESQELRRDDHAGTNSERGVGQAGLSSHQADGSGRAESDGEDEEDEEIEFIEIRPRVSGKTAVVKAMAERSTDASTEEEEEVMEVKQEPVSPLVRSVPLRGSIPSGKSLWGDQRAIAGSVPALPGPSKTSGSDSHGHDPEAEAESLESTNTTSSHLSHHTTSSSHTATDTASVPDASTHRTAYTSTESAAEAQRPIPSRGHQTSWIFSTTPSMQAGKAGEGDRIREPSPSLSQTQSQSFESGEQGLSRYGKKRMMGSSNAEPSRAEVRETKKPMLEQVMSSPADADGRIPSAGADTAILVQETIKKPGITPIRATTANDQNGIQQRKADLIETAIPDSVPDVSPGSVMATIKQEVEHGPTNARRIRKRLPLLGGFQLDLALPLGVDAEWFAAEYAAVEALRKEQGLLDQ